MPPLKSDIPFTIRRSARARRVRVTVDGAGEVIVTLPKKAAERRGRGDRALVPPPRPRGDRVAAGRRRGPRRHPLRGAYDSRAADPLGVVLLLRRDVVQLAAAARPRGGAGLRDRARGVPPRGDGPLAAVLGAAGVALARLARARRLAAPLRVGAHALSQHAPQRVIGRLTPLLLDDRAPQAPGPG